MVFDPSLPNISNLWSVDESDIYEIALNLSKNLLKKKSELWSQAFTPKVKLEIFNNSARIYSWLSEWMNRLSLRKDEGIIFLRKYLLNLKFHFSCQN